jgi:hypothetical protein
VELRGQEDYEGGFEKLNAERRRFEKRSQRKSERDKE